MAEHNLGATKILCDLVNVDPENGLQRLLTLDDMNIWGPQIWIAFKDYCGEDISVMVRCVDERDMGMVACVNELHDGERAVIRGGALR